MTGGRGPRRKGIAAEREFARLVQGQRVPLSGALGGDYSADVKAFGIRWEVKRRAAGWQTLYRYLEGADALALRADRREWLVVVPLGIFLALIGGTRDDDRLTGIDDHLPAVERVYRALMRHTNGVTPDTLAEELELGVGTVRNYLTTLRKQGRAASTGDGVWRGTPIHNSYSLKDYECESPNGKLLPCRSCGQPVTGQPAPNRPGWLRFSCACGLTDFVRSDDPGLKWR